MNKRPNPFLHMILWGAGSGFFFAMLFIAAVAYLTGATMDLSLSILGLFQTSFFWRAVFFYGAFPGAILGLATALNLWNIIRKIEMPINEGKIEQLRLEIYVTTIALSSVLSFMLIAAMFSTMSLLFFLPPIVAAIVSSYAAYRYTVRLIMWSKTFGKRKSKMNDEMYDTSRLQDRQHHVNLQDYLASEVSSQEKRS